jgi:hypothetical protein
MIRLPIAIGACLLLMMSGTSGASGSVVAESGLLASSAASAAHASSRVIRIDGDPLALSLDGLSKGVVEAAGRGQLPEYARRLADALDGAISGKAPKVVAKFAATDAGALALLQWRLLARVKPEELATLSTQHANTLAWLLSKPAALELLLTSGDVDGDRWGDALRILAEIAAADPEVAGADAIGRAGTSADASLALRLAVATALVHANPVKWMADGSTIDPVRRHLSYRAWDREGVLFESFRDLSAWELRYVVGSWSSDDDLVWARANIKPELKVRAKVGDGAHMLAYNLFNKNGVSVQEGGKFYDGKPMTLAVMLEYGGVCGAISRFGTSMSQAFGVPAMPVGQPGHCAFIWQQTPHAWAINNDISGWAESGRHDGIQITWGQPAWMVPLMQDAQSDRADFARSEVLRFGAEFVGRSAPDAADEAALLAEACDARGTNFGAWRARFERMRAAAKDVKSGQWKQAVKEAASALARHPMAFAELVAIAEPSLLPSKPTDKARAEYAKDIAEAVAAMAKAGADATLADFAVRGVVIRQAEALAADAPRAGRAVVLGEDAPADAKLAPGRAEDVIDLAFGAANAFDVAPDGPAHGAWQRQLGRIVSGGVRQPAAREATIRRVQSMVAALMKAKREGDARWLADRLVDAAKAVKDADLEAKAAQFRASLG